MKKIIATSMFILLISILGNSQMSVSELSKETHLQQLKNGILLIQLPNSDNKIKILRKEGNEKLAKKEEKEIDKIRENIIKGFQNNWNYSEFLFFEAENAKEAFQKNPEVLLDVNLKPIKELPDYSSIYSVRYGPGNPNGEVYRYNGTGFQIRYIKDGNLQTIKYDTFYHSKLGAGLRSFFQSIGKDSISKIPQQINQFNLKLQMIKL